LGDRARVLPDNSIARTSGFGVEPDIKKIQKVIVAETTALAGSTTESLRNIELVKSLGLAQQEIDRLNKTTGKILQLELKKVKYLRSLSFIQGTCVNALRTSILGLMLYLIYTRAISVGQFFSCWIYSFFIFGPLQEVGNVTNIYRETEVSLNNFDRSSRWRKSRVPHIRFPSVTSRKLSSITSSFSIRAQRRELSMGFLSQSR
jgi:ABC-type multidrug transport system fused ATPase/permease subunit